MYEAACVRWRGLAAHFLRLLAHAKNLFSVCSFVNSPGALGGEATALSS